MAISQRTTGHYWYNFQLGGRRFQGNTFKTSKREARAVEQRAHEEARLLIDRERETALRFKGGEIELAHATARYMEEHGQFLSAAVDEQAYMRWLVKHAGGDLLLSAIDEGMVKRLVSVRRAQPKTTYNCKTKQHVPVEPPQTVAPATVNRSLIAPLKRLLRHAGRYWKVRTETIVWQDHWLKESQPRRREASIGEERGLMEALGEGFADACRFAFLAGCRKAEVVSLTWASVNFFAREFTVLGKGDKKRTLPMTPELEKLLRAQRGHHPVCVFTYVAQRTDKRLATVKGQRYPITYFGLTSEMNRKIAKVGIPDFTIHDIRRTRATRVWRQRGDAVAVQVMLGHSDLATTMRYVGATKADIRSAMEAAELAEQRASVTTATPGHYESHYDRTAEPA